MTHLVAPRARPVTDAAGNLVLPAEAVTGLFNAIGAEVVIRDLMVTGADAAVLARNDERGNSGMTLVKDVVIAGAGRGILSLGSGDLLVSGCEITNTLWHGVSVDNASLATDNLLLVDETKILTPICAGIYFANTTGFFSGVSVSGASCGGIVGARRQRGGRHPPRGSRVRGPDPGQHHRAHPPGAGREVRRRDRALRLARRLREAELHPPERARRGQRVWEHRKPPRQHHHLLRL